MSNLLNSQNLNINNTIPARKIGNKNSESRYVEAPQSLPKYSIDRALREQDEFRKSVTNPNYTPTTQTKKKDYKFLKIGVISAIITGLLFLFKKK